MIWKVIGKTDEKAIALKASSGRYVSVDSEGRVTVSGAVIGVGEKLQLVDLGQNTVAYKAPNGLYLSVADSGVVFANATEIGDREHFQLTTLFGKVALKAYNGRYLGIRADGTLAATQGIFLLADFFNSVDAGVFSESITLVTYKEPFMLTGLTVEENYGSRVGLFFSHNRTETIAANLLLSYEFLRNSTTSLSEMPSILGSHGSQVFSQVSSFSHKDEAFMSLTNEAMPNVLDMLQAGAGSQILPVISSLEDHFASLDLSQIVPTPYVGASWNANLTAEPVVTSKTLKMDLYNTTTRKSLQIDDVIAEVSQWEPNENASVQLISMMTAWNIGEQLVTRVGQNETKFDFFGEYLNIYSQVLNLGTAAFNTLRKTVLRGYEAYRLLSEANEIWLASGGHIGSKTFT